MLKSLFIKNFILIKEAKLDFDEGFNVLCGETGAGKSIIIKALDCALGAKISKEMILDENSPILIEAVFVDKKNNETVISRETHKTSKFRLNGILSSLDEILSIRQNLLDIHSQHQTYTYISSKNHITLLDDYISKKSPEFSELLKTYKQEYSQFNVLKRKIDYLKENLSDNEKEIDFLKFEIKEIDDAQICENEEENLTDTLKVLSNAQELKEKSYSCHYALSSDSGLIDSLSKIKYELQNCADIDNSLNDSMSQFLDAFEILKDVSQNLRSYSNSIEADPQKIDEINERISLIQKLKRKYGSDIDLEREKFQKRLDELTSSDNNLEELTEQYNDILNSINLLSSKISDFRKDYAQKLSNLTVETLLKLELKEAKFKIDIKEVEKNELGIDKVEFLISANKNQNLMPLSKVASGGEISRVMLALKSIFATDDKLSTVVFDEIDTGISGVTSTAVANCILDVSKIVQIICISHQPIICAKADNFIWIEKEHNNSTNIKISKLNDDSRYKALAQLAGGVVDEKSVEFAKGLVK